jgi:hypothetical protein
MAQEYDNIGGAVLGGDAPEPYKAPTAEQASDQQAAIDALGLAVLGLANKIRTINASLVALITDKTILADATSAAIVITLPVAASTIGQVLTIKKIDASANTVTLDGNASETIDGALTKALTTQWAVLTIQCNGTAWFVI